MKNNLTTALSTLGIIFIALLLIAVGFYIASTMGDGVGGYKMSPSFVEKKDTTNTQVATESTPFTLSDAQKQALISLGVDPKTVPTTITPAQQTCFIAKLGEAKFTEIKNGGVPSPLDFVKVKGCL